MLGDAEECVQKFWFGARLGARKAGWTHGQNVADLFVLSGLKRVASAYAPRQETQQLDDGLEARHESTSTPAASGREWTLVDTQTTYVP